MHIRFDERHRMHFVHHFISSNSIQTAIHLCRRNEIRILTNHCVGVMVKRYELMWAQEQRDAKWNSFFFAIHSVFVYFSVSIKTMAYKWRSKWKKKIMAFWRWWIHPHISWYSARCSLCGCETIAHPYMRRQMHRVWGKKKKTT